jgi:hypothetical protein
VNNKKDKQLIQFIEYLFSGFFFAGILIFFTFFYRYHLHFEEQLRLFLVTWDFFLSKICNPGGLSGYLGGFLTQFYFLSFAGPLIITLVLLAIQQVTRQILLKVNPNYILFPLSFIPSLYSAMILCDEFYPLSGTIGFLIALLSFWFYINIKSDRNRFISGLILLPLIYWLAGGSYLMLLMLILVFELTSYFNPGKKIVKNPGMVENIEPASIYKLWFLLAFLILAAGIPLLVRKYLLFQPLGSTFLTEFYYDIRGLIPNTIPLLFGIPIVLIIIVSLYNLKEKYNRTALYIQTGILLIICFFGFKVWANFNAEEIMTYDYLVRNKNWNKVLEYNEKKPPQNFLSLAMLNLALAKTGLMGEKMFNYDQHGIDGLFLAFDKMGYTSPLMGNEIFYHLGLINASQKYVFEAMEIIPNKDKSARTIKRLAETNLINGDYKVAEKYLSLLEKTTFYRKWAKDTMKYLFNEEMIKNHPDWGDKRKLLVKNDYFFDIVDIEAILKRMIEEYPGNRMAFEYLMAFHMINKDLRNFVNCFPAIEKLNYMQVPLTYQEAMIYIILINKKNPIPNAHLYVNENVKTRMNSFIDTYSKYPDAMVRLRKDFWGTYWYYLFFSEIENATLETQTITKKPNYNE